MIQNIFPKKLINCYENLIAEDNDDVICFFGNRVMIKRNEKNELSFPKTSDLDNVQREKLRYIFRIDEEKYFLYICEKKIFIDGFEFEKAREIRQTVTKDKCFAVATASHLYQWYISNKYCGKCGSLLTHDSHERMLKCCDCGNMVYPKIAPAVIVAVTDNDKILLTKYNGRVYKRYALIAGFTEIGETAEETVEREVMEEVGVRVKNIKYYKSQPWGNDSNLLLGFFAELDGSNKITMDSNELSAAEWVKRDEMQVEDDGISLTREMIKVFKESK